MMIRAREPVPPSVIAAALEAAPASLVLGLSVRDPRLRERSRYALAEVIADKLTEDPAPDLNQLALAL